MREPMTLIEQVNTLNKLHRQRLTVVRTARQRIPVYSSLDNALDDNGELKTLSVDVYATKHLVAAGKSILPYAERIRLGELLLPSINKDISRDDIRRRRRRRRSSYRKSLFHTHSPTSTEVDLAQLTAHGAKPGSQITIPMIKDDDTEVSVQRHHAPPPSPSDDAIERFLYELQDTNQSPPSSRQSPIETEGYVPFRLPALNRPVRFRHFPTTPSPKDVRSTLSNYLQKYY